MSTTGHETERVEVQGLKASLKKGGNVGIYNDCICSTAGATAAKVTNTVPPSFSLTNKAKILVKFTYGINVANATLQVGENAAKPIFYQGSALDAGRVKAGMFVLMQYDGTNFNILGDIAKMDEYYKDLHAGLADNLFGETQTNDKFIFRPTAGIQDIESGEPPVGGGAIRKVEGNAVAWNQKLEFLKNCYGVGCVVAVVENSYLRMTASVGVGNNMRTEYGKSVLGGIASDHVYFVCAIFKSTKASQFNCYLAGKYFGQISYNANTITTYKVINTTTNLDNEFGFYPNKNGTFSEGDTCEIYGANFIDLTLLFGAGNEPSSVEAFESWLSQNIGLKSYYPYNAGELIPVKDYKVKSVGFNAWDGQFSEEGKFLNNLGEVIANQYSTPYGITDYIKVLPSTNYYINAAAGGTPSVCFYDEDKNFISGIPHSSATYLSITTPSNCYYLRDTIMMSTSENYCINLSYDDDKDGTYEPYKEHQVNIDVTTLKGKLNGTGESVVVFPDGMKSAGTVHDEIVKRGNQVIGIKRVGSVDMGDITGWSVTTGSTQDIIRFYAAISDIKTGVNNVVENILSGQFVTDSANNGWSGVTRNCITLDSSKNINCYPITVYSDVNAFRSAVSGIYVYYELATPEEYILDDDIIPVKYAVDDYGTEEVLLGNDEEIVSCAPTMTIKYGINAADTIADLPHDYVSCKPQSLVDSEQRTARNNIAAASQHDMDVVKKQLELIDKKVENDYWVDMGLPSGVIWAKRNIFTGTNNDNGFAPSEYSYDASFFSWGNKEAHNPNGTTFDYSFDQTTYNGTDGAKLTGNIPLSQDAARFNCGEPWRMPTRNEYRELFNNCDFIDASGNIIASTTVDKRTTMNSVVGFRLKSKINGMILFFPYCGNVINTTWNGKANGTNIWAADLESNSDGRNTVSNAYSTTPNNYSSRYSGFVIRPVM